MSVITYDKYAEGRRREVVNVKNYNSCFGKYDSERYPEFCEDIEYDFLNNTQLTKDNVRIQFSKFMLVYEGFLRYCDLSNHIENILSGRKDNSYQDQIIYFKRKRYDIKEDVWYEKSYVYVNLKNRYHAHRHKFNFNNQIPSIRIINRGDIGHVMNFIYSSDPFTENLEKFNIDKEIYNYSEKNLNPRAGNFRKHTTKFKNLVTVTSNDDDDVYIENVSTCQSSITNNSLLSKSIAAIENKYKFSEVKIDKLSTTMDIVNNNITETREELDDLDEKIKNQTKEIKKVNKYVQDTNYSINKNSEIIFNEMEILKKIIAKKDIEIEELKKENHLVKESLSNNVESLKKEIQSIKNIIS